MNNISETLQIDTPENVSFDYDLAGIGSRFLAAVVDTLLLVLLQVIVLAVMIGLIMLAFQTDDLSVLTQSADGAVWLFAALSLLSFLFFWGYYIFFEIYWNGQTPGKRWVGLRVIRMDGTPVTAAEVVIRNLVRVVDLLPTAYGVGVVTMFINEKSRRLGDLAAGTVVVHERAPQALGELNPTLRRVGQAVLLKGSLATLPPDFPLERLRPRDVEMIEEFLLRQAGLTNSDQLADHILNAVNLRLGLPPQAIPSGKSDETLAAIYAAVKNVPAP
jgi:uncharacterized RDD family membrane protein YckC